MGATIALCAVASYVDLGVSYEARAFVGAAPAVAATRSWASSGACGSTVPTGDGHMIALFAY